MHSTAETRQDAIDPRIRVTNQRRGAKAKPAAGELVIKVDRSHPVLGNPFKLHNPSDDDGRAAVIAGYRKKFQKDLDEKGPMYEAALEIARLVTAGRPVCLDCWCFCQQKNPHNSPTVTTKSRQNPAVAKSFLPRQRVIC